MERVWTEKEPLVPEWYDHKDDKRDQADGMPKLTMKLLYGMIQELKQCSDRLSARLDDFEHYMIEVQATRAQLEADAARTIARTKVAASLHDRSAFAEAAMTAPGQAAVAVASPMHMHNPADTSDIPDDESTETFTAMEDEPLTTAVEPETEESVSLIDMSDAASIEAAIDDLAASIDAVEVISHNSDIEELAAATITNEQEEAVAIDTIDVIDLIPLHAKPSKLESQPSYLMSLAQEVLGFTNPDDAEEGLDPGEGANPFDPDSFAAHSMDTAEAQAASASSLPAAVQHSTSSAMTSPFFTPRSQRHPSSKKTFLSLFGFRTRIS
ncbi:hypothetical protein H8B09_15540 [Paenibacillus sp. PR3]|uniref:Uncharacterized protein n=1 Tax=Paenibacillus terricola TaxID=2763503 RepID=A0ABR8MW99_9BACL|nr:hypothetical protein [Paenibacillus terricola]MBD3920178.1 hypothetical protein [Paenibacillus terricola]